MTYLTQTNNRLEQMMEEISQLVEKEVTATIIEELSPHLKNREIIFDESMGSVTFEMKLRDGRTLFITDNDYWVKKLPGKPVWEPRWLTDWEWFQKAQKLVRDYQDVSNKTSNAIHIELTL